MKKEESRHIGKLIKAQFDKSNLTIVKFSRALHTSRNNVYDIFERTSIDTELLYNIGQILQYDFFQYYAKTQPKTPKMRGRVLIEMDLSDEDIIRLGLNEKIFKITKSKI